MSDEEKRIAIAEACGALRVYDFGTRRVFLWPKPKAEGQIEATWGRLARPDDPPIRQLNYIPDYLTDLNAMHEARKSLTFKQSVHIYPTMLRMAIAANNIGWNDRSPCEWDIANASSQEHSTAFLLTLGHEN